AINLEHIGDIIDKNLSELATKKIKRRLQFSAEGAEELSAFHKRIVDSLRSAFGVFMSGDVNEARKLLVEKAGLRHAELAATAGRALLAQTFLSMRHVAAGLLAGLHALAASIGADPAVLVLHGVPLALPGAKPTCGGTGMQHPADHLLVRPGVARREPAGDV